MLPPPPPSSAHDQSEIPEEYHPITSGKPPNCASRLVSVAAASAAPRLLQSVLLHQLGHLLDVGLFGVVLRHSLAPVPGLPLGFALEVEQTGLVGVAVPDGGLLVQAVHLQQIGIRRGDFQILDIFGGLFEGLK